MEVTVRDLMSDVHGLLFGGFFLMAIFGVVVEMCRSAWSSQTNEPTARGQAAERIYLLVMAALGWAAVLTGAYVVYPWYRAVPPAGVLDLSSYPQRLLLAEATTSGWHTLGMEWKEHVAWFAPIAMTMVAYVLTKYRGATREHPQVKKAVVAFTVAALFAAGIAGFFGTMIDKAAPVTGGGMMMLPGGPK
jgi:hypothetical protein